MEIEFINPVTKALNFQELDSIEYQRLENYGEIEKHLSKEAEQVIGPVQDYCTLDEFTAVIVKFTREVKENRLNYSFLSNLELIDYIPNHRRRVHY